MPGSSTSSFTCAEDYQAELSDVFAAFVVANPAAFTARATRTTLLQLRLLHAQESLPRVAYVSLPPDRVFISFSSDPALSLVWRGLALEPGEIMLHGRGERLHQRTVGPSCWGVIALSAAALTAYSKIETGRALAPPLSGWILRPSPRDWKRLLRVHREAARLADTRPRILGHPAVVPAMEDELAGALVACLTDSEARPETDAEQRAGEILVRFEELLAANPDRTLHLADVCDRLGVSDRSFRELCLACLGVSALKYMQLRRLTLVRAAILRAGSDKVAVAELARLAGFTKHSRFAAHYRAAFGETPFTTLRRATKIFVAAQNA